MIKKHLAIFLFLTALGCTCFAQVPKHDDDEGIKSSGSRGGRRTVKPAPSSLSVTFQANHDCYLTINEKPPEKIAKDKPKEINLPVGVHKLTFEEADSTGQVIEQYFRVTNEMAKQKKDSVHGVTFKKDFLEIIQSYPGASATPAKYNTVTNEAETKIRAVANDILANTVPFEGGSFTMGSDAGQKDEAPHAVTVRPVKFGKYEVKQSQWEAVMGYNKSEHKNCPECPVENVSWTEVNSFIDKLNKTGNEKFRLPTEAEWEFVAQKIFEKEIGVPKHPDEFRRKWTAFVDKTTWHSDNARKTTQPVGKKEASLGIYDLLGNVAEWCSDYYRSDYEKDRPDNPQGPQAGEKRVIRGGSFKDKEEALRITRRESENPSTPQKNVGFRLVTNAD